MVSDDSDGVLSVGNAYKNYGMMSVAHPVYQSLTDVMQQRLTEAASVRGSIKSKSRPNFVFVSLDSQDLQVLADLYPEFRLVDYGDYQPGHSLFVQSRRLATDWIMAQASKYGDKMILSGSNLVTAIESRLDVTLVVDLVDPVAVHERYTVNMEARKLYADVGKVLADSGVALNRAGYEAYLRREKVQFRMAPSVDEEHDVYCVDGALYSYSPIQVASHMALTGAEVCYGFFIYNPDMLLNDEGELPGLGIYYKRTYASVSFQYPEGVAGVASYDLKSWQSWLVGHSFRLGRTGGWYQLELLKNRGSFMFYRMVAVPDEPAVSKIYHALELPGDIETYMVTSYSLKNLGDDPSKAYNWAMRRYTVSKRLVDRVYQFAMQLDKKQFNQFAVRKQLRVVNDRVTIEGTSVKVSSALGQSIMDALTTDITARVFVDRYESGMLSEQAREFAEYFVKFSSFNRYRRKWAMLCMLAVYVWDGTLGYVNLRLRYGADWLRRLLSSSPNLKVPSFDVSPSYVLLGGSRGLANLKGGRLVAREVTRMAGLEARGWLAPLVRKIAQKVTQAVMDASEMTYHVREFALFDSTAAEGLDVDAAVGLVTSLNSVDEEELARRSLSAVVVSGEVQSDSSQACYDVVADPVYVLNEAYSQILPGVAEQNLEYDTASISFDPQDRVLVATHMRLPKYFGDPPASKSYFHSRLKALNVPKRQQTMQELLSALAARNLNAPQVALPQAIDATVVAVWNNFLAKACVPNARDLLRGYLRDPIGVNEEGFREWVKQSTPQKLAAVRRELEEHSKSLAEMPVNEYLVMLKADAKPTMSLKPLDQRTEPQVIVYHEKALSALFSCIFRVLVRRFLALIKPNIHVNILKDPGYMENMLSGIHPFGAKGLKYIENDFSKYDKSQGEFAFRLEEYVFRQLGMNEEFLKQWVDGHIDCQMRALSLGVTLHTVYQRKSGDATTAFGNAVLNVMSVLYAYKSVDVLWALFMGDDSLICTDSVACGEEPVKVLAEVFNLSAKTYITDSPYFASNFVVVDEFNRRIAFLPDPVKRVERWSMMVGADKPEWKERYVSARDAMKRYLNVANSAALPRMLAERYYVDKRSMCGVAAAMSTLLTSEDKFRAIWEDNPQVSNY